MSAWSTLFEWYGRVGPEGAAIAVVRGITVALTAWLALAAVLQALAGAPSLHPLRPLADLISPRSMQRLGRSLAGLSLTAGLAAPAPSAGTLAPDQEPPPVSSTVPAEEAATATMRVVDPVPPEVAPPPAPEVTSALPTLTVAGGDSFWSIAVEVLADATTGRSPDEREVASYWRRLVEANTTRLVVPDNPDLLYPGQVLELPPTA